MTEKAGIEVTRPEGPCPFPTEVCSGCGNPTSPVERPGLTGICEASYLPAPNPCLDCRECQEARDRIEAARAERAERVLWTLARAGLAPVKAPTFADVQVDPDNRHVVTLLEEFDPVTTGHGYVITGPVGTGKTYLARALAARMLERQVLHLMVSVPRLMATLRRAMGNGRLPEDPSPDTIVEVAHEVDVMILDDMGAGQSTTPWAEDVLFRLIDIPPGEQGPKLIVTTNLTPAEFSGPNGVGPRIASRVNGACRWVVLGGHDRRQRDR